MADREQVAEVERQLAESSLILVRDASPRVPPPDLAPSFGETLLQ
jgi:hypothetical protein